MNNAILALDISTNTGWAVFENGELIYHGIIECKDKNINYKESNDVSLNAMLRAVRKLSDEVAKLIERYTVSHVIIEQTNKGQSRFVQKLLEWLHYGVINTAYSYACIIKYMDSSEWRKLVGLVMTKEDKLHNKQIKLEKKRGKINKKHLAVRMVNELYKQNFKMKNNDVCDAVLLGRAYLIKQGNKL